jgi:ABC-type transport system involved in multi-copper enzyme maturation permease subunit
MTTPLDYRPAEYTPVPPSTRWWPLARREATSLFASRWGLLLYGLCLIPFLVRAVILMIVFGVLALGPEELRNRLQRPRASVLITGSGAPTIDPRELAFYADQALRPPAFVFVLLLSSMVVARSIARDRMTNALELYWTRGISPAQYVLAKWLGGSLVVGSITVLAPFVLWLMAVFLAPDWTLLQQTAVGMARLLAALALATGALTAIGTLVSGAAATANGATVVWTIVMVGSVSVGELLAGVLRAPTLRSWTSIWEAFSVLVRALAGLTQRNASVVGACACLGGLLAWSWWRARRRLRMEDAIG